MFPFSHSFFVKICHSDMKLTLLMWCNEDWRTRCWRLHLNWFGWGWVIGSWIPFIPTFFILSGLFLSKNNATDWRHVKSTHLEIALAHQSCVQNEDIFGCIELLFCLFNWSYGPVFTEQPSRIHHQWGLSWREANFNLDILRGSSRAVSIQKH